MEVFFDTLQRVCRPMVDVYQEAQTIGFYSDASACESLGFGAYFDGHWLYNAWEPGFIKQKKPSIEYLELFALTAALVTWGNLLQNRRIKIHCDNQAVVAMINNTSSSCKNCMYLLRILIINNMQFNSRVYCQYIRSQDNKESDALSCLQLNRFFKKINRKRERIDAEPSKIVDFLWPVSKIWKK